ncbi:AraC family transcriptional regulator [Chryseobacterium lactis]|uniref:AraC family transcriptional regulator n=1 Tax=Chryseobacterium lactis TaxID=1241981 RepID=A0A3G6RNV4_CHRLC|nr:AraC family transcriptional regulator [Chryseobacterium lactis]AZA83171.1 AraC family transcriptional regulator [Chryseobacterium lactis]AZB03556.1 AraC family transcriptional regulator [Chryseobacterium lactis]PNW11938.1 AraC family transcriptional regulator [Chryseobacterium lactis]
MTLRLYDETFGKVLMEKSYPNTYYEDDGDIQECITQLVPPYGNGFYHEICFTNVHISFGNIVLTNRLQLYFESDFDTVEMHFALKGKSMATSGNFQKTVAFDSYQHNIIYAHHMQGKMEFDGPDMNILEINLAPEFFKKFLPDQSGLFEKFRNAIEKQNSSLIQPDHNRISLEMYQILNDIIHCDRKGTFKRIYLEAKVSELLLLQLEQLFNDSSSPSSLQKKDVKKIYAVRDYIINNLSTHCSLNDLAHQVGTNEFTLKKGFKELFGTTVFGFWNDIKMEQAKRMLLDSDLNISEISDIIGYKNPRHFSAAFKRKYHVLPSKIANK